MSIGIPDLWPDEVAFADVVSPLTILRHQAGQLRAKTKGLLEGEIVSTDEQEDLVSHEFYVVAPSLNRYRYLLLTIQHSKELVYPVTVVANEFQRLDDAFEFTESRSAAGQQEFTELLQQVIGSSRAKTAIHALVAKINEPGIAINAE